ncbi:MAG: hypothetical protein WA964_18865 [Ilumatobacter sp.]|uniref:hypothetical protein n=1 Tax=Ilumatobacter sp. TaxID=1967498 RepID=UPI003C76CF58
MTTRSSFRLAAFACAAGLAGVACGGASGGDDASAPAAESAPSDIDAASTEPAATDAAGEAGAVVPASLQFTAPLIGGGEFVGDELAGKPTAFWFWSPT